MKKSKSERPTVLRERSTSSSSASSFSSKSSLRSFSAHPSVHQDDDDDDVSSNDDTNHQWDLDQLATHIHRHSSKSTKICFNLIKYVRLL